ncbi:MAG: hypothetical protein Q8L14_41475 [Myxococcales bacterium]|nr:hypothetical protein [Myxococcales bacterium]
MIPEGMTRHVEGENTVLTWKGSVGGGLGDWVIGSGLLMFAAMVAFSKRGAGEGVWIFPLLAVSGFLVGVWLLHRGAVRVVGRSTMIINSTSATAGSAPIPTVKRILGATSGLKVAVKTERFKSRSGLTIRFKHHLVLLKREREHSVLVSDLPSAEHARFIRAEIIQVMPEVG